MTESQTMGEMDPAARADVSPAGSSRRPAHVSPCPRTRPGSRTAAGTAGSDMSAYLYGPPDPPWGSFNAEQQASIVDEWFAGNMFPKDARSVQRQIGFAPMVGDPNP